MKRRSFLRQATMGAVLPAFFGKYDVKALANAPWLDGLATTDTDRVLVLVQLFGGNDGINTVVPLDQLSALGTVRNNILLPENRLLALNGVSDAAFHPSLSGFRELFNEKKLSIVQSVGYPSQHFSHFRSTDIWMSASDPFENVYSGWLGRYLQTEFPNFPNNFPNTLMPDPLALQIGAQLTLSAQGEGTPMGMSLSASGEFYDIGDDDDSFPVGGFAAGELAHIRQVARQTHRYGDVVKQAHGRGQNLATYPAQNALADQLKIVARLVKGGLKTRVYLVTLGGFDTHADQVFGNDTTQGTHATLLQTLSESVTAFQRDLEQMRLNDRVLGLTFSEFGRRVRSNASLGSDHGAAAPLFLFGSRLFGGILGTNPTIIPNMDISANLPMQYDFRSVYASVLKDWFCVSDTNLTAIMGRNFQQLRLINAPNCTTTGLETPEKDAHSISNYPNPFVEHTTLSFKTQSGQTLIQIFNTEGQLLFVPVDGIFAEGSHQIRLNTEGWPNGIYYARLQNGAAQRLANLIKIK
jgi:uncharacterized protein (DUF1501 family)